MKSIAFSTLELVDYIHRIAVHMVVMGQVRLVQELVNKVDGMVNGTGFALRSIARSGARGSGRIMGMDSSVHNQLVEVGGLKNVTEGGFVRRWL